MKMLALALALTACDPTTDPEHAESALTLEAGSLVPIAVCNPLALPADPEALDPLLLSIARATSVLSEGGADVHDYEWYDIQYDLKRSRLPPERMREVLDRLFRVAPHPTVWPELELPESLRLASTFATSDLPTADTWPSVETRAAEAVVIFALPWPTRTTIDELQRNAQGAIMHIDARVLRRMSDDVPIAVEVTIATSECGWCQDGWTYTVGADGALLAEQYASEWAASGYCC